MISKICSNLVHSVILWFCTELLYLSTCGHWVRLRGHRKGSSCPLWVSKSQLKLTARADQFLKAVWTCWASPAPFPPSPFSPGYTFWVFSNSIFAVSRHNPVQKDLHQRRHGKHKVKNLREISGSCEKCKFTPLLICFSLNSDVKIHGCQSLVWWKILSERCLDVWLAQTG